MTAMKIDGDMSDFFSISKGVRQGCILSPQLYNIYGEYIIRKALDGWNGGVSVGGRKINILCFADDIAFLVSGEDELADVLDIGCDTWTVKAADYNRIDAFEMWCWQWRRKEGAGVMGRPGCHH
ncbi:hypothetical protein PR048_007991 [Dryococelus australis]|uniref:Reverse transcriptase domain-containing protein n=1 Tax=Dryococelus australis TaxID=614101 RepID=A0ABQ9HVZ9_9NEOP|nr:hypothetical protein PR048_007991 [Dryococelus australis]